MKSLVTSNAKLTGLCFPTASTILASSYCKESIPGSPTPIAPRAVVMLQSSSHSTAGWRILLAEQDTWALKYKNQEFLMVWRHTFCESKGPNACAFTPALRGHSTLPSEGSSRTEPIPEHPEPPTCSAGAEALCSPAAGRCSQAPLSQGHAQLEPPTKQAEHRRGAQHGRDPPA